MGRPKAVVTDADRAYMRKIGEFKASLPSLGSPPPRSMAEVLRAVNDLWVAIGFHGYSPDEDGDLDEHYACHEAFMRLGEGRESAGERPRCPGHVSR